jgi:hypothetical protein
MYQWLTNRRSCAHIYTCMPTWNYFPVAVSRCNKAQCMPTDRKLGSGSRSINFCSVGTLARGGASLATFGEELLARYRRLDTASTELAADDLQALERRALPDPGPKI